MKPLDPAIASFRTRKDQLPTVSLIIPVFRGGTAFQRCLEAVYAAKPAPDEIIIVLDGETADQYPYFKNERLQVIPSPQRLGPAHARNLGAGHARGDILFFIDADVLIPSDAIARVRQAFAEDPRLTALIGSYDDAPAEKNFLSQYRNLLHHYVHQTAREDAATFWGACGAIRRDLFLAHDGFDAERYPQPQIEDIELGYRLKQAGHKIKLCKSLQIKHLKRWNTLTLLKTDFFQRALPWTDLILREKLFLNDLNTAHQSRLSVTLTFCLFFLLILSLLQPGFYPILFPIAGALFFLNWDVYRFFYHKRGGGFAWRVIPWHWLYYFYSGLAFIVGSIGHFLHKQKNIGKAGASRNGASTPETPGMKN